MSDIEIELLKNKLLNAVTDLNLYEYELEENDDPSRTRQLQELVRSKVHEAKVIRTELMKRGVFDTIK